MTAALVTFQARSVVRRLGLEGATAKQAIQLVTALAAAYLDTDASLVEINPLLVTASGELSFKTITPKIRTTSSI